MAVIFKTFDEIEIDGVVAGNIVDVISNHAPRRSEVLTAYGVYVATLPSQQAYDAEVAKVTALTSEKATLTTEKSTLTTQLATATETIATLQARVTSLEAIRAFNPRWITPQNFIARFEAKEGIEFGESQDPRIIGGKELLRYYEREGFYVDMDDDQVIELTAYMIEISMLATPERRQQVLRDATAQEAWYPQ